MAGWTSTKHDPGTPAAYSTTVIINPTIALPFVGSSYSPITGQFSALLVTMSKANPPDYGGCGVDVWNSNCPQPLPFVAGGGPLPTHKISTDFGGPVVDYGPAVLAQDVAVVAGQSLRWNWAVFGEAASFGLADDAWFFATDGTAIVSLFALGSAVTSATVAFPTSGTWSTYFGVAQTLDPNGYSALLIDDVNIVPTPDSFWLAIAALLALTNCTTRTRRVFGPPSFTQTA